MSFPKLFEQLEIALDEVQAKQENVATLSQALAAAQASLQSSLAAVEALQAEYHERLGGVHPSLGSRATIAG